MGDNKSEKRTRGRRKGSLVESVIELRGLLNDNERGEEAYTKLVERFIPYIDKYIIEAGNVFDEDDRQNALLRLCEVIRNSSTKEELSDRKFSMYLCTNLKSHVEAVSNKKKKKENLEKERIDITDIDRLCWERYRRTVSNDAWGTFDKMLDDFTPRERLIIELRFGVYGRCYTLEETGKEIGASGQRARQIEAEVLRRFRYPSRAKKLEDYRKQLGMWY